MRFPYMPVPAKQPIPSLAGGLLRHRPILAVRLTGPAGTKLRDGLLDTGADDTVFPEPLALRRLILTHRTGTSHSQAVMPS